MLVLRPFAQKSFSSQTGFPNCFQHRKCYSIYWVNIQAGRHDYSHWVNCAITRSKTHSDSIICDNCIFQHLYDGCRQKRITIQGQTNVQDPKVSLFFLILLIRFFVHREKNLRQKSNFRSFTVRLLQTNLHEKLLQ